MVFRWDRLPSDLDPKPSGASPIEATTAVTRRRFLEIGAKAALVLTTGCRTSSQPRAPGSTELGLGATATDIRGMLASSVDAGPGGTVHLPPGRIRLDRQPGSDYALIVKGARDMTIHGPDTTLVVTDPTLGCLRIQDSRGCTVTGITIEYDPPPFSQGVITDVDAVSGVVELELFDGYPRLDESFFTFAGNEAHPTSFGSVFDPKTRDLKADMGDFVAVARAEARGGQRFLLHIRNIEVLSSVEPGDLFVYLIRQHGHGLHLLRSPVSNVEDVTIKAANSVGFAVVESAGVRISKSSIRFGPQGDCLVSTNGDAVHAQSCRTGPTIEDCWFEGMMDDGLNVYTLPFEILDIPTPETVIMSGPAPVSVGDVLEFFDPVTGSPKRQSTVASVKPPGDALRIGFEEAVDEVTARIDTAYNLSVSGQGYEVRDTTFIDHRGVSLRLRTGQGLVERNRFERVGGHAILIANDPDRPEGPNARHIVIRSNVLHRVGFTRDRAAIKVAGVRLGGKLAEGFPQRDIVIERNTIADWDGIGIDVGAARDVTVRDNTFILTATPSEDSRAVVIRSSTDVVVEGIDATRAPDLRAAVEIESDVPPEGVCIGAILVDDATLAVVDHRP